MTIEEVKEHFKDAVMIRDVYGDEFDYTKISRAENFYCEHIWVDCVDGLEMMLYNNDTKQLAEILTTKKTKPTKPKHYQTNTIDVIDFCSAYNLNFNRGNVVKYVCRAGRKDNELEDLEKALDYIKREIQTIKNK